MKRKFNWNLPIKWSSKCSDFGISNRNHAERRNTHAVYAYVYVRVPFSSQWGDSVFQMVNVFQFGFGNVLQIYFIQYDCKILMIAIQWVWSDFNFRWLSLVCLFTRSVTQLLAHANSPKNLLDQKFFKNTNTLRKRWAFGAMLEIHWKQWDFYFWNVLPFENFAQSVLMANRLAEG